VKGSTVGIFIFDVLLTYRRMFRKHSTAAQKPPTPSPVPSPSRPETSSESSISTGGQSWKIDQDLINKGLQLLPTVLTPQNRLDFLTLCALENAEADGEWLDFDYCSYLLGLVFNGEFSIPFYLMLNKPKNMINVSNIIGL
jgi:hypothetical protein